MGLRKLKIGYGFIEAFGRDADFQDTYEESAYLDTETGEMIWVYEEIRKAR
jgi:hypothetical protein|tara:strand:- start:29 stop:181 length:153 start_codon:yes stop_codon:yes gene_type:complete